MIITQGKDDVIIAQGRLKIHVFLKLFFILKVFFSDGVITRIPAIGVPKENIVDTNGAGDAFVGGKRLNTNSNQSVDVLLIEIVFFIFRFYFSDSSRPTH